MRNVLVIKTKLLLKGFEEGVKELKEKADNVGKTLSEKIFSKISHSSNGFLKVIGTIGKTIAKLGGSFALIGVALTGLLIGASLLYKAFKKAWGQNKQAQADLKYLGFAFGEMLNKIAEPLVGKISKGLNGLVQLLYKILQYINYISIAWFNVNLFENATADNFKKAREEAEKLKKTTASFDEMNIIGGNNKESNDLGPSFDLSAPENIDPPKWLVWIAQNKEVIIGALAGIALGLLAIKLANPTAWIALAIVAIGALVGVIIKNWDKIKETLGTWGQWLWDNVLSPAWNYIKNAGETVWSYIKYIFSVIEGAFTTAIEFLKAPFIILWETVKGVFDGIKTTVQGVFDVIKGLFTGDWQKVMDGFKNIFKGTFNILWSIAKAPLNLLIDGINAIIKGVNKIGFDVPDWVPIIGGQKWGFNLKTIPRLAQGAVINQPGYGVPVGYAGEAGMEGIVPMSNEAQMELIGRAIAKYLTINLTNITDLDGRTIARSIKRIQGQNDFAMNR